MSSIHSFRSLCTLSSAALSLLLLAPLGGCQRGSRNDQGEDIHRATTTYGTSGPSGQVTAGGAASQQMNRGDDATRRTGVTPENPPASDRPNPAGAGGSMGNAAGGMGGTGGTMGGGAGGAPGDRTGTTHTGTTTHTDTTHKTDDKTGKKTDDNKKGTGTTSTDTTRTTTGDTNR